jgi:hypothetical protein
VQVFSDSHWKPKCAEVLGFLPKLQHTVLPVQQFALVVSHDEQSVKPLVSLQVPVNWLPAGHTVQSIKSSPSMAADISAQSDIVEFKGGFNMQMKSPAPQAFSPPQFVVQKSGEGSRSPKHSPLDASPFAQHLMLLPLPLPMPHAFLMAEQYSFEAPWLLPKAAHVK